MALSSDYIRTSLQNLYGNSVSGADIRAWCALNDANYQTVTKKLDEFKVGRGKWNLEVTQQKVEEIERTFQAPAVVPPVEQNLIPEKDDTSSLVTLLMLKRLFSPVFFILRSLRVFRVMVKRSVWSKHVLNLSVN
jgi:hypothetical protein